MGKALYRRYRSRSLSEIVGQQHITDILEKSLKTGKISHAYLFVGPRGTGKTSVARILAHEINGFDYEIEDDYLDIIEIDAASNTGVDNIRDLREKAIIAPTKGKYKIYIIDEVHMLSKSAFNALLKTLEEPPEHVVFIMATTDAHKVPVTITSRSQSFVFRLASPDVMLQHLRGIAGAESIKISDGALKVVVRRSGGSFRDAISLLDQVSTLADGEITEEVITKALGLPQDDLVQQLYGAYLGGGVDEVTEILRAFAGQGIKAEIVAEELMGLIVERPCSGAMGLLDKLVDVPRAGYPEVKLLLALLSGGGGVSDGGSEENTSGGAPVFTGHRLSRSAGNRGEARPSSTVSSEPPSEAPPQRESGGQNVATGSQEGMALAESAKFSATSESELQSSGEGADGGLGETVEEMAASHLLPAEREGRNPVKTGVSPEVFSDKSPSALSSFNWENLLAAIQKEASTIAKYVSDSDYEVVDDKLVIYARKAFAKNQIDKKRNIIIDLLPDGMGLEVLASAKNTDATIANIANIMGGGEEVRL
ncbi:MAG: DNA polymerase III subunit gamma/tau [Candidatus Nomurabacteria bacterium]|jgi:DNA polymerase-3 subunit gamma/tau|nr:DNA polymerase III subunit gamma/tau [Candidatus Nomurabacteria bacterium]